MKKIILTVALFCSTALNAQVKHLDGFEKTKLGYIRTVFTEDEAIKTFSYVMDMNGVDTLQSVYTRGDNPVVFSFFKTDEKSKKVNVAAIIHYNGVYDVLFMTIKDQDATLFSVKDKNGEIIDLIYEKPE
jgi:hypothetical protein